MAKTRSQFVCQNCGRTSVKMMGRCPQCGEYNTFQEQLLTKPSRRSGQLVAPSRAVPRRLDEISDKGGDRLPLSIQEFSRVLGGGVVPGSISLIGGDPGIGKSTLLLQTAMHLAEHGLVLYVSGEESEAQIKMRAQRLTQIQNGGSGDLPDQIYLVTETNLEQILAHIDQLAPTFLVIDSIQTTYLSSLESSPGSLTQVRECASQLRELAKSSGIAVFLIGHVTKEGAIAGPRVLEHIVDTVLYLEGDRFQSYRLLRSVKNRFGATSEVGVFEMRSNGMIEVPNPSEAFLAERMVSASGSAIAVTMEATRPLLVEVQGLTSPTSFGHPRRTGNGIDTNRLLLLTAVLTRHVGAALVSQDVFVNVIGGLKIGEPAADLAVAAAIASSMQDRPVKAGAVLIGEVGLSGELRSVSRMPAR
ncbi:MAG: DNA repair protein RadA, partial [Anaerolineae bacterium]|nr:DNA repair protein RadA [Anaerolineae bacterium]